MRGRPIASLCTALLVGLAPASALAGRSHGGHPRGAGGHHHGFRHHGHHHRVHHRHSRGNHHGPRAFRAWGAAVYAPPAYYAPALYAPPAYAYPPAVSYDPQDAAAVYAADYRPAVYASVTLAPAPASIVEYPHGRYELRGDGIAMPYTWVWIPNPPPPPPAAAPTAPGASPSLLPPGTAPPADPPPDSDRPRPSARAPLYRWTDELGVMHWTNRADAVPPAYRTPAAPATGP